MGYGWEMYGRQAGYTQQQWDNLTQAKRNDIKAFIDGLNGGPVNTALKNVASAGQQGFGAAANAAANYAAPPPPPPSYGGYDSGGGYDGGGGGGGSLPPRELATSPEWLAYLNALGLEENQFRSDIERQRAFARTAADQQIAGLEPQYQHQRGGIAHGAEAAGMARSGGLQKGLADSRARQGQDVSNINQGLATTLSGLESTLANKLMDLGARRAQQELSLRASGYV